MSITRHNRNTIKMLRKNSSISRWNGDSYTEESTSLNRCLLTEKADILPVLSLWISPKHEICLWREGILGILFKTFFSLLQLGYLTFEIKMWPLSEVSYWDRMRENLCGSFSRRLWMVEVASKQPCFHVKLSWRAGMGVCQWLSWDKW